MINIRQKTQAEMNEEEGLYRFAAAVVHGLPKSVCPTYLIGRDGRKVNTNDLTEDQILELIQIDLIDYVSPQGSYKRTGKTDLDSFKLANVLKGHYIPSLNAALQMLIWEQQYGHIVTDLMGSIGTLAYRDRAKIIAVIEQMIINEQAKKNASSMKR